MVKPKNWLPRAWQKNFQNNLQIGFNSDSKTKKSKNNNLLEDYIITTKELSKSLFINEEIISLLYNRGYKNSESIINFLNPKLKNLYTPVLLPNIKHAFDRLIYAYENKQKIIIFGDYDTDGVISTALIYNFLKRAGFNVKYYIPNRFEEGYDINIDFLENIILPGKYNLIICVDCGTNAFNVKDYLTKVKICNNYIDVIVLDHHEPLADIEESYFKITGFYQGRPNYIIVNPKLLNSNYPFKHLSGAGVVFKFIVYSLHSFNNKLKNSFFYSVYCKEKIIDYRKNTDINIKSNITTNKKIGSNNLLNNNLMLAENFIYSQNDKINLLINDYLKSLLDLVSIATVADLMPLVDENRIIVSYGLKQLKNTKSLGLKHLIKRVLPNIDSFSTYDIGFIIAPRLNAAGRVKTANNVLKILIDEFKDLNELENILEEIEKLNYERQKIQNEIYKEIVNEKLCNYNLKFNDCKVFIEHSENWHEGVLGIVASKIVKKINLPVILFKDKGSFLKGSGRSIDGFNLYENLNNFKKYFIKFGGHSQACGITISKEYYSKFREEMLLFIKNNFDYDTFLKKYYYDLEIDFKNINKKFLEQLLSLEPFGIGNPKPMFYTRYCEIIKEPKILDGNENEEKHVFLKLKNNKVVFDSVIFDCKYFKLDFLKLGKNIDILYSFDIKNIKNKESNDVLNAFGIQLVIVDFITSS